MKVAGKEEIRDGYRWVAQDCPICHKPPTKFVGRRGGSAHRQCLGVETAVWKCTDCNLVFPNPMPFPIGGLGQHYDVDANEYFSAHDEGGRDSGAAALVKKAEKLTGHRGKLLDIGVGRGEVLKAAIDAGWECEGVEPSTTFADYAEEKTGAKIWREPIEESTIPEEEFEAVILSAVLEHLYDPDEIVRRIAAILKPGGVLYIDVPNEAGLYFILGNLYQKIRGRDWSVNLAPTFEPYHVFGFSPRSLRKLLDKHGFDVADWYVYPGTSLVPRTGGIVGKLESVGSKIVTGLSRFGERGTYIEAWGRKRAN